MRPLSRSRRTRLSSSPVLCLAIVLLAGIATATARGQAPSTGDIQRAQPSSSPSASFEPPPGMAAFDELSSGAAPEFSFTHLVGLIGSEWTHFKTTLDFPQRVGNPTELEPTTKAALGLVASDAERTISEWQLRNMSGSPRIGQFWVTDPSEAPGSLMVIDEQGTREILGSLTHIVEQHIDPLREGPDLLAYLLTKNPWIRDNWREGAHIEDKIVDYGWVIGLGVIAYQAQANQAQFSIDVKVLSDPKRDLSLSWRTKVDHFGVRLEPDVHTGVLVERKLLAAEATIGAGLRRDGWNYSTTSPEADLRIEHRWVDLLHPSWPNTYLRVRSDVKVPLGPTQTGFDNATIRQTVELSHTFDGGERVDLSAHADMMAQRFTGAGLGARYTPAQLKDLSVFADASYADHHQERLYTGPLDEYRLFMGVNYRF